MRGKQTRIPSYLSMLARSDHFRKYAIMNMTGTSGRKRVDYKQIAVMKMVIPPKDLLKKFQSLVYPYFLKMTLNTKQNQKLTELRDWLLPMLMNGQVTVKSYAAGDDNKGLGMVAEGGGNYNLEK